MKLSAIDIMLGTTSILFVGIFVSLALIVDIVCKPATENS